MYIVTKLTSNHFYIMHMTINSMDNLKATLTSGFFFTPKFLKNILQNIGKPILE